MLAHQKIQNILLVFFSYFLHLTENISPVLWPPELVGETNCKLLRRKLSVWYVLYIVVVPILRKEQDQVGLTNIESTDLSIPLIFFITDSSLFWSFHSIWNSNRFFWPSGPAVSIIAYDFVKWESFIEISLLLRHSSLKLWSNSNSPTCDRQPGWSQLLEVWRTHSKVPRLMWDVRERILLIS